MIEHRIAGARLVLLRGDLTREATDAIVNAANTTLLGGGVVDGAIHRAGGPAILEARRKLDGCKTGDAVITTGGRLPARFVTHTVGPVAAGGARGERELLASAYRRSLEVASASGLRSISFPSISTGAYRFPIVEAASIAIATATVRDFLSREGNAIEEVRIVLFHDADRAVYLAAAERVLA